MDIYVNGAFQETLATGLGAANDGTLTIGFFDHFRDVEPFNGLIDEVRVSNIKRTAAWIKASYESAMDDMLDFGSEEVEVVLPPILNTPDNYPFGVVNESSTTETGLTYFTVTNNSGYDVNITIGGTDMTGGTAWTLSDTATPGIDTYGL
ncbi:hypothetical protein ES708_30109 [subsurface metagenome]